PSVSFCPLNATYAIIAAGSSEVTRIFASTRTPNPERICKLLALITKKRQEIGSPASRLDGGCGLSRSEDCVLGGFRNAEFDHFLGRDFDGLAGGRVATHAGFAIHKHQFAEAREGEGVL